MNLYDPSTVEWWLPSVYLLLVALTQVVWSCGRICKSSAASTPADESLSAPLLHGERVRAQHRDRSGDATVSVGAAYGAIFQCLAVRVFDAIVAGRSSAPVTHVRCNQGANLLPWERC